MNANYFLVYALMILASFMLDAVVKYVHFFLTRSHYKEHHFLLGRYILSLLFPFVVLGIIYSYLGFSVLYIFLASALFGTLLEWVVGWWFSQVMGMRLWTYHRYTITKYTSFLSVPLWGVAGVFLWLIVKAVEM